MLVHRKHRQKRNKERRLSRTAVMRGLVAPFFGLLAVACIVLGVFNAYMWRPSRQITAKAEISNAQYVTTDPGVLQLVGKSGQLTVNAPNVNICVALGTSKDVAGWVSGYTYSRVTGLTNWSTLSVQQSRAQSSPANVDKSNQVAFKDSDMWSAVKCGVGKVTLDTSGVGGDTVALADLGGSNVFSVNMFWVRDQLPDFATPFYFAGGLCAVLTVLCASVFAMPSAKRRKRQIESSSERATEEVPISEAVAGSFAGVKQGISGIGSLVQGKRRRSHRRHAASGAGSPEAAATEAEARHGNASPLIIEPTTHNMVSEQQGHQGKHHNVHYQLPDSTVTDNAETSVISREELSEYFARFASESSSAGEELQHQGTSTGDVHPQQEEGERQ